VVGLELKINPEYKALIPELLDDEYENLKESISKNGYWEEYPIIVNDNNEILDGHSRWKACQELGIQPIIKVKHFESKEEEMRFVIETNLNRRHLNAFQKAELALKLIELEKTKRGRKPKEEISTESVKISTSSEPPKVDTWQTVSDKLGVSRDTIEKAKAVIEKGDEELIEKCRRGEISVNEAYKRVREIKASIMHPKELMFEILTKYFENQDLDTLYRLKENLGAIHEFLNELLSKGLLDKKGLEFYKKKIETLRDLLGEIASWDQYIIERKENK
jgi:ParB-like chromosome segregation protein Spo0J